MTRHATVVARFLPPLCVAIAIASLLGGCARLGDKPEARDVERYVIPLQHRASARIAAAGDLALVYVPQPIVAPEYASRRMAYRQELQTVRYFGFSEWAAAPADMLQRALHDAFDAQARLQPVASGHELAGVSVRVDTRVLEFIHDFTVTPSEVRVAMRVEVWDPLRGRLLAAATLDERAAAPADSPAGGIAAYGVAVERIANAIAALCADSAIAAGSFAVAACRHAPSAQAGERQGTSAHPFCGNGIARDALGGTSWTYW